MERRSLRKFITLLLIATLVIATVVPVACARSQVQVSPADFYKENKVTLVCPFEAGGGTDLDARVFASFWNEATGGTMVNENKVGAGGITGWNYIYSAKPDGLLLGFAGTAVYPPMLLKDPAVKYDVAKFTWLGAFHNTPWVLALGKHIPYKTIKELQQAKDLKLKLGSFAENSQFAQAEAILADIFGLNIKIVPGYGAAPEMTVAVGKKELDGYAIETQAFYSEVKKGFLQELPILAVDFEKSGWYPNVPAIPELTTLSAQQKRFLEIFLSYVSGHGKAFLGPPGIPADRVQFLRDATNKVLNNAAFAKQMKTNRYPVWEKPMKGEQIAAIADNVGKVSDEEFEKLNQLAKKYLQ